MRTRLALLTLLLAGAAHAQAPSPAQMGITSTTTPEVLQTLDSSKTWVPLGRVDPVTHTFGPSIDPRDFSAKCDGTTDDNAALNAAATAAKTAGKALRVPNAVCYSSVALNFGSIQLVGATPVVGTNPLNGPTISCAATIATPCVTVGALSGLLGSTVRDVIFSFTGTPVAGDAALNVQGFGTILDNVAVYNAWDGYLFSNGLSAHGAFLHSGRITNNHVVQNGFPEIYLNHVRFGINGVGDVANSNAFFGITGADPNSLVCTNCQLNLGSQSPKYVYDFYGLTSQGNGVYKLTDSVIDMSIGNGVAIIHSDGSGTCFRCIWSGVTINAPALPFFSLGSATSMNQAVFTDSNFFVSSFTLPPIHYVGLRLSNLYINGSLTINNDTGGSGFVSDVTTGGAIVVQGVSWTSLNLNSLYGGSYTDVAATGNIHASNVPTTSWTPRLSFGGANVGMTTSATYGKSSRQPDGTVKQTFGVGLTAVGSSTGAVTIEGAPYACSSYGSRRGRSIWGRSTSRR